MRDASYDNPVFDTLGICDLCAHRRDVLTCDAYPNGIPGEVLTGDIDHRRPYSGDQGIQFEVKNPEDLPLVEERFQLEPGA